MSSSIDVVPEQLCYITCNFCNIVLAVSVPSSNMSDMVTVRCGRCTNLWSVNMAASIHSLSSQDLQAANINGMGDIRNEPGSSSKRNNRMMSMRSTPTINIHHSSLNEERLVNRPPEKKQRVPSAYNQFIKEEIQRIKANNPDISHRQAFSTAAKNWAHYPHIQFGLMLDSNNQPKMGSGAIKCFSKFRGTLGL